MSKVTRLRIFFIGLISITIISGLSILNYSKKENPKSGNQVLGTQSEIPTASPWVANKPITYIKVGTPYDFSLKIADEDTPLENINVDLVEFPSWLSIKESRLYGFPNYTDVGTSLVRLKISDGKNEVDFSYYIRVGE